MVNLLRHYSNRPSLLPVTYITPVVAWRHSGAAPGMAASNRVDCCQLLRKFRQVVLGDCFHLVFVVEVVHGVTLVFPGLQTTHQGANAGDPDLFQLHGNFGARGLAGTSAVEDDLAIARDLGMAKRKLVGRNAYGG